MDKKINIDDNIEIFECISGKIVIENGFQFIKDLKEEAERQRKNENIVLLKEEYNADQQIVESFNEDSFEFEYYEED
jgi:hypothetical protein